MVSNRNDKKVTIVGRDKAVVGGIQKNLQGVQAMQLAGSTYTPADVVKLIESRATQVANVEAANAAWHAAIDKEKELNVKVNAVLRGLRQYVINAFGATSPVLADFGFSASVRKPLTPEENVARTAKAKATRAARHTMGKVQKKKVKGTVPTIVTPSASTAAATPVVQSPTASAHNQGTGVLAAPRVP